MPHACVVMHFTPRLGCDITLNVWSVFFIEKMFGHSLLFLDTGVMQVFKNLPHVRYVTMSMV